MEFFLVYLFLMIEKIGIFLMWGWAAFWIPILLLGAFLFYCVMEISAYRNITFDKNWDSDRAKKFKKFCKRTMIVGFIIGTLGFFTPTQKDLAIIVSAGVTYNVITSEPAKRIGGKALDLLEQKIDEALKDKPKEEPKK